MATTRALIHGPGGARTVDELAEGQEVYSRDGRGNLSRHRVTGTVEAMTGTTRIRARGRNITLGSDQLVMRVLKSTRTRKFSSPCETANCNRVAGARGRCGACYQRLRTAGMLPETWTPLPRYATELVRTRDMRRGDLLVVLDREPDLAPSAVYLDEGALIGIPVTGRMAWLFGAIVGDGTVNNQGVRVAAFDDFDQQVTDAFWEVFRLKAAPHPSAGLIVSSVSLGGFLMGLGFWRRGEDKRVPEVVWSWPQALQLDFCAGYAAADGHFGRDGQSYASCSRRLLDEVRTLHMRAGHRVTNVTTNYRNRPIVINGKPVLNARPLHNFVVSSHDPEPYAGIPRAIVADLTGGPFGLRVVLGVDDLGMDRLCTVEVEGASNVVIDGVPVWEAVETEAIKADGLGAAA